MIFPILVSLGEHGASLTFELAIANCTPFVPFVALNWLSPVVPRSWLKSHLRRHAYNEA